MFLYWKIFVSAYDMAYSLGEREQPHVNAFYFMCLTLGVNLSSLINVFHFFFWDRFYFFKELTILAFVLSVVINTLVIFFISGGYRKQIEVFDKLYLAQSRKKAMMTLIATIILTIVLLALTGFMNNPKIKSFLM